MAATKLILTLPVLLIVAASMQAEALQCYQCEDCADIKKHEMTLTTCSPPESATKPAPTTTPAPVTTPASATTPAPATTPSPTATPSPATTPAAAITPAPDTTPAPASTPSPATTPATTPAATSTPASTTSTAKTTSAATTPSRRRKRATETELKNLQCAKITYKVGDETKIKRQCSYENKNVDEETRCTTLSKNLGQEAGATCEFCDKDKCNSATKFTVASTFIVMGLILTF